MLGAAAVSHVPRRDMSGTRGQALDIELTVDVANRRCGVHERGAVGLGPDGLASVGIVLAEDLTDQLFHQILDICAEEIPMIGILGELPQPVIVKNGLMGVPDTMPIDDPVSDEHIRNPQTFWWDDPSKHTS